MKTTRSCSMTILWTIILFAIVRPSEQYVYTCDSTSTCGCSTSPASITRIVGGESAGTQTWGWAVYLNIGGSLCGGAILSNTWIISAAHCLYGVATSSVTVYAGSNSRSSTNQIRYAAAIIVHPGYSTTTYVNDIALVQLSAQLTMSDPNVNIVCMPSVSAATLSAGEWPTVPLNVVAVGWGRLTQSGSLPTYLQQVTLQTVSYRASTCSSLMYNPNLQLCAGVSGGGKDTCQGDSGGPLMMFTASNQWVLVGLTSNGIGCAQASYSGIYTRVAYYQSWISSNTGGAYTNAISSDPSDAAKNVSGTSRSQSTSLSSLLLSLSFVEFYVLLFV